MGWGDDLTDLVLEYWIQPCHARVPRIFHGACNFWPAILIGMLVAIVAMVLSHFEKKAKAQKAAVAESTKKSK